MGDHWLTDVRAALPVPDARPARDLDVARERLALARVVPEPDIVREDRLCLVRRERRRVVLAEWVVALDGARALPRSKLLVNRNSRKRRVSAHVDDVVVELCLFLDVDPVREQYEEVLGVRGGGRHGAPSCEYGSETKMRREDKGATR